jgi:antitoxin component YwqK of YwqJK toxin-antitoxin module
MNRLLLILALFSPFFLSAQESFVIEGDTLTITDDDWDRIILTGGEGEGIYWMKDLSRKEIPVFYRFYPNQEVEYMQFGILKGKDFTFHGPGRFFYPDGEIQGKIFFRNGLLESVLTEYYENGQLALLTNYENDLEEGLYKTFYENGQLWQDNFYEAGELEGMQKSYYPNGKLESQIEYEAGEPTGLAKTYYDNGNVRSELTYEEGLPHGTETIYYADGELWSEREYVYGQLMTVSILRDPLGDSLDIGTFANGYGTLNVYDDRGKLIEQSIYRRGDEVRRIIFKEEEEK